MGPFGNESIMVNSNQYVNRYSSGVWYNEAAMPEYHTVVEARLPEWMSASDVQRVTKEAVDAAMKDAYAKIIQMIKDAVWQAESKERIMEILDNLPASFSEEVS